MFKPTVAILVVLLTLVFAQANSHAQELAQDPVLHQESVQHQDTAQQKGRDPTRPLGYQVIAGKSSAVKDSGLHLSSVLISAQRKLAIINGQSLREGQIIPGTQGIVLVGISARGVTVAQGGRRWELRLAPSVIKKN